MNPVPIFYIERTKSHRVSLRRYKWGKDIVCPNNLGGHDAEVIIDPNKELEETPALDDSWPHDDSRWPKNCSCGYEFKENDEWQIYHRPLFYSKTHNRHWSLMDDDLPIGAVWNADWYVKYLTHPTSDGRYLICKCPGGSWDIDGRASNCTRKNEPHFCWVRHGKPEDGTLHVDKNGNTCAAGAGSIWINIPNGWHGFLHNGHLRDA